MKKLIPLLPILFLLMPVMACDSDQIDKEDSMESSEFRSRDSFSPDEKLNLCDYSECKPCDWTGEDPTVPPCKGLHDEGFGCCTFDLENCVPVGYNPDGSCNGVYMWCDYYEINPDGSMDCWDIFGQG